MTTRLAIFDCDGTLVDGQAAVCDAMEAAFSQSGLAAPDRNEVRRSVGLSLHRAVAGLLPDAGPETQLAVVESYKRTFRDTRLSGSLHEPLYDGIAELLDRLSKDGWLLAVATGKSDRGLNACLKTHGIRDRFISLQTADRHPSKPHPAMLEQALADAGAQPGEAVMIGDTTFDIDMAHAASVRAIGVAWGYHTPDELRAAGASQIAETPHDLGAILT